MSRLSAALRKLVPQGTPRSFHEQSEWPSHASQGWGRESFQGRCKQALARRMPVLVWAARTFLWAGEDANFLTWWGRKPAATP